VPTELKTEDVLVTVCGGGAGVGAPEERDPEAVKMDVRNDLVSLKVAKEVYRVVLDPETLEIDHEATEVLRHR
jgi:N-methylhydantoinase B/oxoprolinase/acetone carboxylase alpha subunit